MKYKQVMEIKLKPDMRNGSTLPRVRAVSRAISILRAFTPSKAYLALGEIVKLTGLDAGTTRRLLVTLRDDGLVRQESTSGLYCASVGLIELSHAVPESLSLSALLEIRIKQLAEDTQTTVYLSTVKENTALCMARYNGGRAIEVRWWAVGEHRPFNRGTGPRVLLAFQSTAKRDEIIDETLGLDVGAATLLRGELEEIRSKGAIVKHDEIAPGLSAMAVPLLDVTGKIIASISTGGLTPRYIGGERAEMQGLMIDAATDMQKSLRGFSL